MYLHPRAVFLTFLQRINGQQAISRNPLSSWQYISQISYFICQNIDGKQTGFSSFKQAGW